MKTIKNKDGNVNMADLLKEIQYKLRDYPNVKNNMAQHPVFNDLLIKASDEQLAFINDFFDEDVEILFSDSRAGTGKTFITVACCYADFLNHNKNMYFVSAPVSDDIGALPGSKFSKESVFFSGLYDALDELGLASSAIFESVENEDNITKDMFNVCWVHAISHVHMRGANVNCNLICEESQNFKRNELKKVLTRVKEGSTVCVVGSSIQIDLKNESKSGFVPYLEHFKKYPEARFHTLNQNFRSRLSNFADDFKW